MEDKRKRRTKNDIEESIRNAAVELIEEKGFQGITVTGIMQKAKIEPIVFYNRYDDLNEFMDEFVKRYDYWFSDIAKKCELIKDDKEQCLAILNSLFAALRSNKMMQQLLRWELSSNNDITRRTARLREFHTLPLAAKYKKLFENSSVEIDAVSALIVGGIYYLTLHADLSEFSGININSPEGEAKIQRAIEYFGNMFFAGLSPDSKTMEIAKRMKEKGLDFATIQECTGLSTDVIESLVTERN